MEARIKFLRREKRLFGKGKIFATKETAQKNRPLKKGGFKKLERAMGFGPTTSTLARLRSTPELYPHELCSSLLYYLL